MSNDTDTPGTAMPVFVAYYARGTDGERDIERLRASLERHGLEHYIEAMDDRGSWHGNVHYKPVFIQACLERFPDRAVVYLDADIVVERYPELFDGYGAETGCDLAVHYWFRQEHGPQLFSDVIYLANTPGCREAVAAWIAEQEFHPDLPLPQANLQTVVERLAERIDIRRLPKTYCHIVGWTRRNPNRVIAHFLPGRRRRGRRSAGRTSSSRVHL